MDIIYPDLKETFVKVPYIILINSSQRVVYIACLYTSGYQEFMIKLERDIEWDAEKFRLGFVILQHIH